MNRHLRAFLIAPLTAPLLYCAGTLAAAFADPVRRGHAGQNLLSGALVVFAAGAPIAYAAAAIGALPALWIERRFGRLGLLPTIVVGLIVGGGVAAAIQPFLLGEVVTVLLPAWGGALMGAGAAGV